jgi:hypothetical protein
MRSPLLIALCLLAVTSCVLAQEVLKAWEFNTEGDTEGWLPAHSLAPFVVADGVLRSRVTGGDPYMHASEGHAFDIEGNGFQYVEIRMKHDAGKGAEFFWAATTEGRDAGFVAGKERGFACVADDEWHTYHVYPLWQGTITRLRLDAPGGDDDRATIEIDYIRIIQGPRSEHDPRSPTWDLTEGNGGWVAVAGGTHLAATPEGARSELTSESLALVSPIVDLQADDYKYAFVEFNATADLTGALYWSATDNGNFPGCNMVTFEASAGTCSRNLSLSQNPMYGGEIRRLKLTLAGDVGASVTLKAVALAEKPLGPAHLRLVSFAPQDALTILGRPGKLVARVENDGGEEVRGAKLTVSVVEGPARIAGPATGTVASLAPGASAEVVWAFAPVGEGRRVFKQGPSRGLARPKSPPHTWGAMPRGSAMTRYCSPSSRERRDLPAAGWMQWRTARPKRWPCCRAWHLSPYPARSASLP